MNKPLGVINNNPLNMRPDGKSKWQGLANPPTMSVVRQGSYLVFVDPTYGWRAAALNLIAYQDRRGINTIRKICETWAPAADNNHPLAYAQAVSRFSGFDMDEPLDLHTYDHMRPVIVGMARVELGGDPLTWYTAAQIDKGLVMAGVQPPQKPVAATRTAKGAAVATASTAGTAAIETVQNDLDTASSALWQLAPYLEWAKYALIAITLIGVGWMVYARISDRKRGLR